RAAGNRCGETAVELGAVQTESARTFGEVPVITDVDADFGDGRLDTGITRVAGAEVILLPESRGDLRDVMLAVLAEVLPVGVNDGGGVVVHAGVFDLVNRHHDHHAEPLRDVLKHFRGRTVRNWFGQLVPARLLLRAEVRPVEEFLQAQDLHALRARLLDERRVFGDNAAL